MLYFYGLIAGVLIYRVPMAAEGALLHPRYIRTYLIGVWGVFWALLAIYHYKSHDLTLVAKKIILWLQLILLSIQFCLIFNAWNNSERIISRQNKNYFGLIYFVDKPSNVEGPCSSPKGLSMCRVNGEKRAEVIEFLKKEKLNVFAPEIAERRNLNPK
jgi:hypothetical protein